MKKAN